MINADTSSHIPTALEIFQGKPFVAGSGLDGSSAKITHLQEDTQHCQFSCGGNLVKLSPTPNDQHSYIEAFRISPYASCSIIKLSAHSDFKMCFDGNNLMSFSVSISGRGIFPSIGPVSLEDRSPFGSLTYAPPEALVTIESTEKVDYQSVSILFNRDLIEQSLGMSKQELPEQLLDFWSSAHKDCMLRPLNLPYRCIDLASDMLNSQEHSNFRYIQLLSLANTMMFEFLQSLDRKDTNPPSKDGRLLARAKNFLDQNLAAQYSLSDLAREVGLCRTRLIAGFKEQYGTTVTDYHREVRLQEAYRLITQTAATVASVAEETGFSSSNHFATAFKKRWHKSPSEVRKSKIELWSY
ncbi:helix-turn-helix transcriptional regulator [Pseudomaricurvus alkylphenolicus]|uniref:helix-turn-helix domain-containing protein n=1 Tax=Pseudomaricurvus alkylphenolicus TaxID=1306991 RepID=UPI0014226B8D|nr:helix-turn-helix domain-containing protein [Pseudomaricurvus alkylphenolicus]NIB38187.1 helix-turn-helix transcriptional regulator [Pseudomaricurvus alkylphenolicus]